MTAPAFTPGPWSIDGFSLVVGPDPKDRQVRVVADCRFNARANARLIAAAPELYEALTDAMRQLRPQASDEERAAYKRGHAALAKARGEQ